MTTACTVCQRPCDEPTATLCGSLHDRENTCWTHLDRALGDVAALTSKRGPFDYTGSVIDDLHALATGQTAIGTTTSAPTDTGDQQPGELPLERASRLLAELHQTLRTAVHTLSLDSDQHGHRLNWNTQHLAKILLGARQQITHHENAAEIHDSIVGIVQRCRDAIDRPADREYAGRCWATTTCTADLYATPGATRVECTACGWTYDVGDVRTRLLEVARDRNATAVEIARALTQLSSPLSTERIVRWAERGRLIVRGHIAVGGRQRALYRVGDVQDLLAVAPRKVSA